LVLETTERADRINPNGAGANSEGEVGAIGKDAPVSIRYGTGFGWIRVGTESEVVAGVEAEATTGAVGAVLTVATEVDEAVGMSPITTSPITIRLYR